MALERVKELLQGLAKSAIIETARGYITERINSLQPDDIIHAIENDDTDLIGKLTERDKKIFYMVARKFGKYIDFLTVENVMRWMLEDVPFHAGIIYGHPKGLEWLRKVIENIRTEVVRVSGGSIELVPVSSES
jgi:hypothetical protein